MFGSMGGAPSQTIERATVAPTVLAAGGIVLRTPPRSGLEVAIVHRPDRSDWSLPKGKLEPGESPEHCALREVREETGLRCSLGRIVGDVQYLDRRGRRKIVTYWLMEPLSGRFRASVEVDRMRFAPIEEALGLLSYPHDRRLVESVTRDLL